MSHVSTEGINLKIEVSAITKCGETIIKTTEDIYNTFDDLRLYVAERLQYESFAEMREDGIEFLKGINTIRDCRDRDVTYVYKLVK